ncbi:replication endonuclease [Thiohalorhabdus denitrificans]|uniref:Bacteriophage replication gene A protein (GPA) n=1 Tax=Thiohalorhabdus denitrificans TaxID=381306 RepID=A0A1G5ELP7_9GAMM|nr:Bacteriophage replication gene A protein (GPA) [Thiohalorhabdus denitrificans]
MSQPILPTPPGEPSQHSYTTWIATAKKEWAKQEARTARINGAGRYADHPHIDKLVEEAGRHARVDVEVFIGRLLEHAHPAGLDSRSEDPDIRKRAKQLASVWSYKDWLRVFESDAWPLAAAQLDVAQVAPPPGTPKAAAKRAKNEMWWRRRLRDTLRTGRGRIDTLLGLVEKYVSPFAAQNRREQETRSRETLERLDAVSNEGDRVNVAQVADAGRRGRAARLKAQAFGYAARAQAEGLTGYLVTLTCPSRMHPGSHKWDGTMPDEAAEWLREQWRLWYNREGRMTQSREPLHAYMLSVVEPHKDGAPHLHAVVWTDEGDRLREGLREYFLYASDPEEPGADERRVQVEAARSQGGAVVYALKYATKYATPEALTQETAPKTEPEFRHEDNTVAVRAWRGQWGIRGFDFAATHQQAPPVGVWDELRRVPMMDPTHPLFPQWQAAQGADWAGFMDSWSQAPSRVVYEVKVNAYGEEVRGAPRGVDLRVGGAYLETRPLTWSIEPKPPEEDPACYEKPVSPGVAIVDRGPRGATEPTGTGPKMAAFRGTDPPPRDLAVFDSVAEDDDIPFDYE